MRGEQACLVMIRFRRDQSKYKQHNSHRREKHHEHLKHRQPYLHQNYKYLNHHNSHGRENSIRKVWEVCAVELGIGGEIGHFDSLQK